ETGRETGWGYSRIEGELRKLGIRSVAKSTIANLLKEHGLDPAPKRGPGGRSLTTWNRTQRFVGSLEPLARGRNIAIEQRDSFLEHGCLPMEPLRFLWRQFVLRRTAFRC